MLIFSLRFHVPVAPTSAERILYEGCNFEIRDSLESFDKFPVLELELGHPFAIDTAHDALDGLGMEMDQANDEVLPVTASVSSRALESSTSLSKVVDGLLDEGDGFIQATTSQTPINDETDLRRCFVGLSNDKMLQSFLQLRNILPAVPRDTPREDSTRFSVFGVEGLGSEEAQQDTDTVLDFPSEVLSRKITLPAHWTIPQQHHRYLAALPFLQRRAMIQCLFEDCNVQLTEFTELNGADLILDSHSAVKMILISDVVPSNLHALSSSIIEMGYRFSRILIILEAYPTSLSNHSLDKLRTEPRDNLCLTTDISFSTSRRLKRSVTIGSRLIGPDTEGENESAQDAAIGDIAIEFVLSKKVEETAYLIRLFGNHAESCVSEWERQRLWGDRPWLEKPVSLDVH